MTLFALIILVAAIVGLWYTVTMLEPPFRTIALIVIAVVLLWIVVTYLGLVAGGIPALRHS